MRTILWFAAGALVCAAALLGILFVLDVITQVEAFDYGGKIAGVVVIAAAAGAIIAGISRKDKPLS